VFNHELIRRICSVDVNLKIFKSWSGWGWQLRSALASLTVRFRVTIKSVDFLKRAVCVFRPKRSADFFSEGLNCANLAVLLRGYEKPPRGGGGHVIGMKSPDGVFFFAMGGFK
jgi:hypothetical protein